MVYSAGTGHGIQFDALGLPILWPCLGLLVRFFGRVNVSCWPPWRSKSLSHRCAMSFKLPARPVTSGCVAFGERVVMVCVTDRDDRITRHNSWRHAGGWHCANCAAVIQPGVPANCVLGCDNSTHASGCQQPALWGAGCTACNWCRANHGTNAAAPNCRPEHAPCLLVPTMSGPSTSKAGIGPATARVEPLTVRDLKSRFLLDIRLPPNQSEVHVHRALLRVFRHYGLPKAIWVDNGPPFGGVGPLGYSRLAVWWRRLGIRVEYGRPAHPQDNAAHEQMHGVYQIEVAAHPAIHPPAGQRQSNHWRNIYNQVRPHEALNGRTPAQLYRPSPRKLPRNLPDWSYPSHWHQKRVSADGRLFWQGRQRHRRRAFGGEKIDCNSDHRASGTFTWVRTAGYAPSTRPLQESSPHPSCPSLKLYTMSCLCAVNDVLSPCYRPALRLLIPSANSLVS